MNKTHQMAKKESLTKDMVEKGGTVKNSKRKINAASDTYKLRSASGRTVLFRSWSYTPPPGALYMDHNLG